MQILRTVEAAADPATVFAWLSDFTHTEQWDPGTVSTVVIQGDGGVGTTYLNVSKFLGRETELTYEVVTRAPDTVFEIHGTNDTVDDHDTIMFVPTASGGTRVVYHADFRFHGVAKYVVWLLWPAFKKLGDDAEKSLRDALATLSS